MNFWELTLREPKSYSVIVTFWTEQKAFEYARKWAEARYGRSDLVRSESFEHTGQYVWPDSKLGDWIVGSVINVRGVTTQSWLDTKLDHARISRLVELERDEGRTP